MRNSKKKNTIYVEDNNTNICAKFQLLTSDKKIFEYFFRKFNISVAMATNQNQRFGQNSYGL